MPTGQWLYNHIGIQKCIVALNCATCVTANIWCAKQFHVIYIGKTAEKQYHNY